MSAGSSHQHHHHTIVTLALLSTRNRTDLGLGPISTMIWLTLGKFLIHKVGDEEYPPLRVFERTSEMWRAPTFFIIQPQKHSSGRGDHNQGPSCLQMQNQPQKRFLKACSIQRAEECDSEEIKHSPSQNISPSCKQAPNLTRKGQRDSHVKIALNGQKHPSYPSYSISKDTRTQGKRITGNNRHLESHLSGLTDISLYSSYMIRF